MIAWLLAFACSSGGPPAVADSGPALPDVVNPVAEAQWTPDEARAQLQGALDPGLPEPWDFAQHYLDLLALGDAACPGTELFITDTHLRGCTAASGTWYAGITEYYDDWEVKERGWAHFRILLGDLEIIDAVGQEFGLGGHVMETGELDNEEDVHFYVGQVKGTLFYEGAEDWYRAFTSGILTTSYHRDGDEEFMVIDGAIQVLGVSMDFQRVEAFTAACGLGLRGRVQVRDPSGGWHRLTLDEGCGGCGAWSFAGGEPLGEQCVDLGPALDKLRVQAGEL